jgi:hypothetical protein
MKKLKDLINNSFLIWCGVKTLTEGIKIIRQPWDDFRAEEKAYFEKIKNTPPPVEYPNATDTHNGVSTFSALG